MRHYKGGLYLFLGAAQDSTNSGEHASFAVYDSLRDRCLRVRRLGEFEDVVPWPDGEERPRFVTVEVSGSSLLD
jgi:hypothetical protein